MAGTVIAPTAGVSQTCTPSSSSRDRGVRPGEHDLHVVTGLGGHDEPHLEADPQLPGDPAGHGAGQARGRRHLDVVRPQLHVAEPGDLAEEAHHEVVGGLVVELVGGADLLDPALVDHHDLVGDLHRLLLVVGHEDRGHVHLVVEPAQPLAQLLADLRVQRTERLVEQQHLGLHRERPGQRHPLPLPTRELGRQPVAELREVDELEQLVDPAPRSRPWAACGSPARTRRSWPPSCA